MATKKQIHYAKQGITKVAELKESLDEIAPDFSAELNESPMDLNQAFGLYIQFSGDVQRTAHALNVSAVDVLRAADRLGWAKKLEPLLEMKKGGRAEDIERSISRAMSFVQAHRLRVVLERVLARFYALSDDELYKLCFSVKRVEKKDGSVEVTESVNTKVFSDFAAALEKCHSMASAALTDTATDRAARKDRPEDAGVSATALHSIIAAAMSGNDPSSPAGQLLQEHIETGEQK